ncbi:MAG TPA: hypothetical protein VIG88_07980 [Lysobacter sp.]
MRRPTPTIRLHTALLAACLLLPALAGAQGGGTDRRDTGDAWVDARLADIDSYAATYRDAFVDEMARYHRAPRELVRDLLARPGWTPGDVYFACGLARHAGRPCRAAADLKSSDPVPDRAALARELGVAPGSPGFHAFKHGIVATYARWARPIRVDAELAPDFPKHPRDAAKPVDAPSRDD